MYESGAVWVLTAADGTSVTFNDGNGFYVDDVTGFDSPNVRQNLEDLPEQDGAAAGSFYYGARPVTLSGTAYFSGGVAARNQAIVQLQAALRGLRGDITVKSQAQGLPAMQAYARLDNLRVTKGSGVQKQFIVSLICPDPLIYSQATNSQTGTGLVALSGAAFPLVFPIDFGGGSGATVTFTITNAGNFDTPPVIRITGPISDPRITNATRGESFYIDNVALVTGEYVDVDMRNRTVMKSDGANLYSRVRFPSSTWWKLSAGANSIELRSSSVTSTATLLVAWRDAWA